MQNNRFCFIGRRMQHTLLYMPRKSFVDAVLVACMLLTYLHALVTHSLLIDTQCRFGYGCEVQTYCRV